jgi:potassium/hydrogen antiporter
MALLQLSGTNLFLLVLGLALLVGFASDYLATRFRIPDVIWLMGLGLVIGPVLGLISSSELLVLAPVLGVAALVLILFDAGLDMRFGLIRSLVGPAFRFAAVSFGVSALVLAIGTYVLYPAEGVPAAALFGLSLGCTSGAVVIPLARRLRLSDRLSQFVQLDAAFEDTLAIVSVSVLLVLVSPSGGNTAFHVALAVLLPLPVGIGIGVVAGIAWLEFLSVWQDQPYAALATLGFLLAVYTGTEVLGGSGVIAALVLGIVLANESIVRGWFGRIEPFEFAPALRKVQGELAFLLRSFFLLLLGLLANLRGATLLLWIALVAATIVLFSARWWIARRLETPEEGTVGWGPTLAGLYGRGLTSAVLIVVAFGQVRSAADLILPAVLLVLLTSVLMTIWLLYLGGTDQLPPPEGSPTPSTYEPIALAP